MWSSLRPFHQIVALLTQIVKLLTEQNQLLRELHLKTTGHHALTRKVDLTPRAKVPQRTGRDVWQSTPRTWQQVWDDESRNHEKAASEPSKPESTDTSPKSA